MLCLLLALVAVHAFADQVIEARNLRLTLPDGFSEPVQENLPSGGVLFKSDAVKLGLIVSVLVTKRSEYPDTLSTPSGVLLGIKESLVGDGRILREEEFVKDGYCGLRVYLAGDDGVFTRWEAIFVRPYAYLLGIAARYEVALTGSLAKKIVNALAIAPKGGKADACDSTDFSERERN
jgi:hypothetical protein